MPLISLKDVSLSFSELPLIDHGDLHVEERERIGLLGSNGAGKTTLMRLLSGELQPDSGEIFRSREISVAQLPQDVPDNLVGSALSVASSAAGSQGRILAEYLELAENLARGRGDAGTSARMDYLHGQLDLKGGWELQQRVESMLVELEVPPEQDFSTLSGGLKRRVILVRTLAAQPDLVLLDEPTNHLDIKIITWLEDYVSNMSSTLVFVTHDRRFLQRVATRIVEVDRGRLLSYPCDYKTHLERKEAALAEEEARLEKLEHHLRSEEIWIRKGIKARRTRNEGRVRKLMRLREERRNVRSKGAPARMLLHQSERGGKVVAVVEGISLTLGGKTLFTDFSTILQRGDKVGIIGRNGTGKTSLLRVLLGQLAPDSGTVQLGTGLELNYFEQLRTELDLDKTVKDNISAENDHVFIGGRSRHVMAYLQDFGFSAVRAETPVRVLSGGERNRVLLARVFTRPSNLLVMDEPTNDLDMETLEILENLLVEYEGTLLLVSHDREFLNNVVTSTIVLEDGRIQEFAGGYDDWLTQKAGQERLIAQQQKEQVQDQAPKRSRTGPRKLTYNEQRELEALPDRIAAKEQEKADIEAVLAEPETYRSRGAEVAGMQARLVELEKELDEAMERWAQLEEIREGS